MSVPISQSYLTNNYFFTFFPLWIIYMSAKTRYDKYLLLDNTDNKFKNKIKKNKDIKDIYLF